jgi:hypothetical protein
MPQDGATAAAVDTPGAWYEALCNPGSYGEPVQVSR